MMKEDLILAKLDEIIELLKAKWDVEKIKRLVDIGEDLILQKTDHYQWILKQHYKEIESEKKEKGR